MGIRYRRQLVDLLKQLELPLIAAELGVAEGNFSRDLLASGLDKLYSVDAWEQLDQIGDGGYEHNWHDKNYESAVEKLKPFGSKSVILRGISYAMADKIINNYLGLCYVDCDHSYGGVTKDIEAWYDKIVMGGVIAFHDYENENYGVKRAVKDFCDNMGITEIHLLPEDKKEDAGAYFFKQ